jgi:hypothetical protein
MVNITHILVALILFAILLAVAFTLLAGVVPGFSQGIQQIQCGLGLIKCP